MRKNKFDKAKILIFPIINIIFFIMISSFGQMFMMEIGLSFIIALVLIIVLILNMKKVPTKILLIYFILIIYTLIETIGKNNFYLWTISIFTIAASFSLLRLELTDEEWKKSFFITALFSMIVVWLYGKKIILTNWNSNSIAMFSMLGIMGYIPSFNLEKKKKRKIFISIMIIISIYVLYVTDSRNSLLMFLIAFVSSLFVKQLLNNKLLVKGYAILGLLISGIVGELANAINKSEFGKKMALFSKNVFEKGTLFSDRENFWIRCKNYIGDDWLLGTGNSLYKKMYSHNMFYSAIYSYGIIGYTIYVVLIYQIIKYILKYINKDVLSINCILIFIAILFGQITENLLFTSDTTIFLPYMYLSIGLKRAIKNKEKINEENNNIHTNIQ